MDYLEKYAAKKTLIEGLKKVRTKLKGALRFPRLTGPRASEAVNETRALVRRVRGRSPNANLHQVLNTLSAVSPYKVKEVARRVRRWARPRKPAGSRSIKLPEGKT